MNLCPLELQVLVMQMHLSRILLRLNLLILEQTKGEADAQKEAA